MSDSRFSSLSSKVIRYKMGKAYTKIRFFGHEEFAIDVCQKIILNLERRLLREVASLPLCWKSANDSCGATR